ncbi:YceI family protein [Candidatus Leptofilum sp.]|uniref:YceI family protein n=1 Tax=Candidatus Leptofilum sp. TaxID=3241576 RepID=UPI003B5A4915
MKKNHLISFLLVSLALLLVSTACGLLQEPAEPSATIEAVPLEIEEADEPIEVEEPTPEAEEPPVEIDEAEEPEEEMEEEEAEELASEEEEEAEPAAGGLLIFEISQDASEVRFELDEDLRGNRITVVGSTDQVAGQIALDLSDLSSAQVGEIQINARTLETDNNFRNRAIQNEILDTGDYEFISFVPTAVSGLPASATIGEEISFTIEGDLTIRDVTEAVTFSVVATAVSETEISGTATATVLRETYGLNIPEVPNVANVENEVDLIISFVANK